MPSDQPTGAPVADDIAARMPNEALDRGVAELVGLKPTGHLATGSIVWRNRNGVTIMDWHPSVKIAQAWAVWEEAIKRYGVLAVTEALEFVLCGVQHRGSSLTGYVAVQLLTPETICQAALRLVRESP